MHLGVMIEPQFGYRYADTVAIAREAETAGFRTFWVSDHLLLSKDATATDCLEAWTLLAALAVETKTIRIGPMVTAQSYRNPALLAKMAAGVDHFSNGRLDFGVGAGWKEVEYTAYGYDFPPPGVRVTQLAETLRICSLLWEKPRATYRGKHYRIEGAVSSPKPVQSPLPVWVGGTKPRVMRIAARYAQWFNMSNPGTPAAERIAFMHGGLDEACRAVGRDPATLHRSLFVEALVASTRAELDEIVAEVAKGAKQSATEWRSGHKATLIGTTDEVGTRLREIAKAGVEHSNVRFPYKFEVVGVKALREVARAL